MGAEIMRNIESNWMTMKENGTTLLDTKESFLIMDAD